MNILFVLFHSCANIVFKLSSNPSFPVLSSTLYSERRACPLSAFQQW